MKAWEDASTALSQALQLANVAASRVEPLSERDTATKAILQRCGGKIGDAIQSLRALGPPLDTEGQGGGWTSNSFVQEAVKDAEERASNNVKEQAEAKAERLSRARDLFRQEIQGLQAQLATQPSVQKLQRQLEEQKALNEALRDALRNLALEKEDASRTGFVLVQHESMPSPGLSEDETENETPLLGEAFARGSSVVSGSSGERGWGSGNGSGSGSARVVQSLSAALQVHSEQPITEIDAEHTGQRLPSRRDDPDGQGAMDDPAAKDEVKESAAQSRIPRRTEHREKQYGLVDSLFWWWGVPDEEEAGDEDEDENDVGTFGERAWERNVVDKQTGRHGSFVV